jgi:hypothetical protein
MYPAAALFDGGNFGQQFITAAFQGGCLTKRLDFKERRKG